MCSLKTSLILQNVSWFKDVLFSYSVYLCDVHVQKVMVTKDLDTQPQQMTHVWIISELSVKWFRIGDYGSADPGAECFLLAWL